MNRFLLNRRKEACCGCGLCAAKCPAHCIKMQEDFEGFYYPEIDASKCLNCNLCSRVCPFEVFVKNPQNSIQAYAANSKDDNVLKESSSGGIFFEIASRFLEDGGCVCGATINENHKVHHIIVHDLKDLPLLQGSKYVQSDLSGVWDDIGTLLRKGKKILFCGTPCQISALKNAYKSTLLYSIDVLCHGVPSQKLFDKYIYYLEEKHQGKLLGIWFRDKEKNGWSITQKYSIERNGKIKIYYLDRHISEYFSGFLRNMTQRESCFHCPYTTVERCGDVTLADFWGVEKVHPEYFCEKGTSLVLANNDCGRELLAKCIGAVDIHQVPMKDALVQNPQFKVPPKREKVRDHVYKDIYIEGFKEIGRRYILPPNAYKYKIAALFNINISQLMRRMKK